MRQSKPERNNEVTVVVDEKGLDDAIGIELVIIQHESGQDHIYEVIPLPLVSKDGNLYTFKGTSQIFNAGSFKQVSACIPKIIYYHIDKIFVTSDGFKKKGGVS